MAVTMNMAEKLRHKSSILELLDGLIDLDGSSHSLRRCFVSGVQLDSRLLKAGDLFLACFGKNHDAREFVPQAIELGVAAVVVESGENWQGVKFYGETPVFAIDNLSAKLSEIAARFYQRPSEQLTVIGITGTNGKTSCSQFVAQALSDIAMNCGVIGTLGYGVYGDLKETSLTTPDAVFTQAALSEMVDKGIDPVVMEVSSIGLDQKRVKAVEFDIAVFTNLSRDHLDYHNTMDEYAESKKKLFTGSNLRKAVVNLDDAYALLILNGICSKVDISTFSMKNSVATVYATDVKFNPYGYEATINTPLGVGRLSGVLLGSFNFYNLLAVVTTLIAYLPSRSEITLSEICDYVSALKPVTGRMEIVGEIGEITAVVDYAHTPDGLKSALIALKEHYSGEIVCVFGCGGNRDSGKRPLMGEVAEAYADQIIITDDNPRNEDGDAIINHVLSGIVDMSKVAIQRDRASAISAAIQGAKPGDVVLIAGKGHETYQDVAGERFIFSDVNHVRLALQKRAEKNNE
jgi:UDP-N-acetylmuramoyl-L-alanyl-D-glutamate--2,6-diaminopimelate ligase